MSLIYQLESQLRDAISKLSGKVSTLEHEIKSLKEDRKEFFEYIKFLDKKVNIDGFCSVLERFSDLLIKEKVVLSAKRKKKKK